KRVTALAQKLATIVRRWYIAGKGENVLGATFLAGNHHSLNPFLGLRLVVFKTRGSDLTRIRRHQFRQIAIDGASLSRTIGGDGFAQSFAQAQNLLGDLLLPRCVALETAAEKFAIIFKGTLRGHIERAIRPS